MKHDVTVLGIFVVDAIFRGDKAPAAGETVLASSVQVGPGGKGSNQAVAAAKMGAKVTFLTRLGRDAFADMALDLWARTGVTSAAIHSAKMATGAATIFVDEATSQNQIIVCPGAALQITAEDIDNWAEQIKSSAVFLTQLEQPLGAAKRALQLARDAGVTTILNPAPAVPLDAQTLSQCDFLTPNETEATTLTGITVDTLESARRAGDHLLALGVRNVVITLGEKGALFHSKNVSTLVPAFNAGPLVDTTGAGDAFNGGFAVALSQNMPPLDAVRFGCAVASFSVTKPGAAASMPDRASVQGLLDENKH